MRKSLVKRILAVATSSVVVIGGATIAVLFARGNTITPEGIKETGTIRLTISPTVDFTAYLNEQAQRVSTNDTLDNVLPGTYELRIQQEGYNAWRQEVEVSAGLVTDVSVQLFPGELPPEQLTKTHVNKVFYSRSGRTVFYAVVDSPLGGNVGIWQQTLQRSNIPLIQEVPLKITNFTNILTPAVEKNAIEVIPSLNDSKLLLIADAKYYILNTGTYNEPTLENEVEFTYNVDSVSWINDSSNLLVKSGELLIDYDIDNKRSTIITYRPGTSPIYSQSASKVFYANANKLYQYVPGTNEAVKLENTQIPSDLKAIYASRDNDRSLVLKTGDNTYFLDIPQSSLTQLGNYSILSVAPSARHLIVKDGKGRIQTIEVEVSLLRDTVESTVRNTGLPDDIATSSIVWSPQSIYFVYQAEGAPKQLFTSDRTGNNISTVLLSETNIERFYGIPGDNSGIIVKLQDSVEDSVIRSNLYKLNFEVL